jgi:cytoskeletal protein CcmA (bactofilin family)
MFSKPNDTAVPPRTGAANAGKSVLSSDLKITGDITSTGAVEVLGEVDGTIAARTLSIGAEGSVSGDVTTETVEIKGRLDGRVKTQEFVLRSTAKVAADITYTGLTIDSGAQIEGRFNRPKG